MHINTSAMSQICRHDRKGKLYNCCICIQFLQVLIRHFLQVSAVVFSSRSFSDVTEHLPRGVSDRPSTLSSHGRCQETDVERGAEQAGKQAFICHHKAFTSSLNVGSLRCVTRNFVYSQQSVEQWITEITFIDHMRLPGVTQ